MYFKSRLLCPEVMQSIYHSHIVYHSNHTLQLSYSGFSSSLVLLIYQLSNSPNQLTAILLCGFYCIRFSSKVYSVLISSLGQVILRLQHMLLQTLRTIKPEYNAINILCSQVNVTLANTKLASRTKHLLVFADASN